MRTMWERNMVFEKLKTLNLRNSQNLTPTPDFNRLPCLETIDLAGCSSLEEVDISVGSLVRLVSLDLGYCSKLRSLPDSICSLRALEVLIITGCSKLEALPTELGKIESLKVLHASQLSVSKLPDSVGRLSNLVELKLIRSKNLETLPKSICNLRSLEFLDISECEKLEECPDQLGKIRSLRKLDARSATMLKMLPDISQLSNIEYLDLSFCHHLFSISELPPSLKYIGAENCRSVKRLPDLSHLKKLEKLELTDCSGLTEIQGLEELTSLKLLKLTGCNSSLLACILTKRFFQIFSGFEHEIVIHIPSAEYTDWIGQSNECVSTMSLDLQRNASHNFLGIILVFEDDYNFDYSVKNITSGFIWSDTFYSLYKHEILIIIVPGSIFSIGNGDHRIEVTSTSKNIIGIHLVHKSKTSRLQ